MLLDLGLDPNAANKDGRTALMGAAHKGRNEVVQLLVDRGASWTRATRAAATPTSRLDAPGATWQALDYADGLVRVGVQSAVAHPETAALIRKMMTERGIPGACAPLIVGVHHRDLQVKLRGDCELIP